MNKRRFPLFEEAGEAAPGGGGGDIEQLRNQLASERQRFDMLQNSLQSVAQAQPQQQQHQPTMAELNAQVWANPVQSVDQLASTRAAQAVGQAQAMDQETMVELAKSQARASDPEVWDRYIDEIMSHMQQVAPPYHRNVGNWRSVLQLVAGRHYRELRSDAREAAAPPRGPAIRVSDGPASPSTRPAPASAASGLPADLRDEAMKIGKKLGMQDPEGEMKRGMHLLANQGSDSDATAPSAWDEVITFDSRYPKKTKKVAA